MEGSSSRTFPQPGGRGRGHGRGSGFRSPQGGGDPSVGHEIDYDVDKTGDFNTDKQDTAEQKALFYKPPSYTKQYSSSSFNNTPPSQSYHRPQHQNRRFDNHNNKNRNSNYDRNRFQNGRGGGGGGDRDISRSDNSPNYSNPALNSNPNHSNNFNNIPSQMNESNSGPQSPFSINFSNDRNIPVSFPSNKSVPRPPAFRDDSRFANNKFDSPDQDMTRDSSSRRGVPMSSRNHTGGGGDGYQSDCPSGLSARPSGAVPARHSSGMVLSKIQDPATAGVVPPASEITSFFREFKPIDCHCCNQLMGFQHRVTGYFFCTSACIERDGHGQGANGFVRPALTGSTASTPIPPSTRTPPAGNVYKERQRDEKPLDSSPNKASRDFGNRNVVPSPLNGPQEVQHPAKRNIAETRAPPPSPRVPEFAPPKRPDEPSYRNVSTIAKHEERSRPNSYDTVDKKAPRMATEEERPSALSPPVPAPIAAPAPNPDMIAAASIRKTKPVNPFFKKMPGALDSEKPKISGDEERQAREVEDKRQAREVGDKRQAREVEDKRQARELDEQRNPPPRPKRVEQDQPPTQLKVQAEPQVQAAAASTPPQFVKKVAAKEPEVPRIMWQSCKYSDSLVEGAPVKMSFMWNVNKLQVVASADENRLNTLQDKVGMHLKLVPKLSRPPVIDEMVLGEYNGEYYRGRVTKINGDKYKVVFVDFGDAQEMPYTEMYPISEYLLEDPIFSTTLVLEGVATPKKKVKIGKKLNDLFENEMILQLLEPLVVSDAQSYKGVLWVDDEKHLNGLIFDVLAKMESDASAERSMKQYYDIPKLDELLPIANFQEEFHRTGKLTRTLLKQIQASILESYTTQAKVQQNMIEHEMSPCLWIQHVLLGGYAGGHAKVK
ncbi:uncharacterized protein LOC110853835 isoform X1 [Folsomia candida]|uniref:uncharacterized protein LOC110853835 isoform X1 n=1 Tax=Folsomia candida TaxID=158441 RepID=UPI001604B80A|nr:uncharacterized protein LOC110853835 isoform X1 [Folsomia candida]